ARRVVSFPSPPRGPARRPAGLGTECAPVDCRRCGSIISSRTVPGFSLFDRRDRTMSLTVKPLTPAVGAEIIDVDLRALNDADFAPIEQAWPRYSVLLFRDQSLTDDHLLAFSRRFGELDPPPNQERGRQSPPGYPDVYVVSNVLDEKGDPIGALGAGEAVWHTDMSYL